MLQPTNRLTLIDAMRPPSGFGLESAMGVTFTLDLRALIAAPAAFALTGPDSLAEEGGRYEPIELLHALRSHAGKLTVFNQVGEIALPPSRRVFAFLERSVIPAKAPLGGVVHPKVWVLRYEALGGSGDQQPEKRLRALIASRNLTFDASWDTVVRLDESVSESGADLGSLGDLFDGLLNNASMPVSSEHEARVRSLSTALRAARFALPDGVDELRVSVLGLAHGASPLPLEVDRSLIISPFVGDGFFTGVRSASVDELVSRPESLDLLGETVFGGQVRSAYAFDDGSSVDVGATQEELSPHDPGRPLVGLHAKVFAFEEGSRARVFFGSANATGAAFKNNVEVLVELRGSVANLGIDRICDGTDEEPGLRSLFTTYARPESFVDEDGDTGPLDRARHAIALLPIEGFVHGSDTGWAVIYRSRASLPAVDAVIRCWPLASPGNRRQVTSGQPLDVRFETTLETISGFLAFEISDVSGSVTQFVVPVPLHDVPELRERALLKALVGNAERFLRYVLALLEEDRSTADFLEALDTERAPQGEEDLGPRGLPVLEKLLRTMRRDPAKLAGLHPLVTDLAADDALPPGFAELWETIYEASALGTGHDE